MRAEIVHTRTWADHSPDAVKMVAPESGDKRALRHNSIPDHFVDVTKMVALARAVSIPLQAAAQGRKLDFCVPLAEHVATSAPCEYARSPIPSVCRKPGAFLCPERAA